MEKKLSELLIEVQSELKAPKNQFNSFAKYNYRSCEDIIEAVKPILKQKGLLLTISDEIIAMGNRFYVKATAGVSLANAQQDNCISATAFAREPEIKKGMDDSQITGTASSYARKYALNGLFLIDDTKDADTDEHAKTTNATAAKEPQKSIEYMTDAQEAEFKSHGTDLSKVKTYYKTERLTKVQAGEALKKIRKR